MRLATDSVGLVSPRSTWDSIGAETPQRSARSRSERRMASRRERTRGPTAMGSATGAATAIGLVYVITYARMLSRRRLLALRRSGDLPAPAHLLERDRRGVVGP